MHRHRDILPLGLFLLGLRALDAFLSFCCVEEVGEGFGCVDFARLFMSCRKLQLSPLGHCPLDSHCQQSPRILCTHCFVSWILDHDVSFKISVSGFQILISYVLLDTSFYHCLQSVIIRSYFLVMNLQVIQFQCGLEFLRLSYS